jgi:hypothetical protein
MKKIICLTIILFACLFANSQFKQIAASASFDEPENEMTRLVLMKDGSVILFTINPNDGINLRIYNSDHKESVVTTINPDYKTLKSPSLVGSFEINGYLVLLISEIQDKTPVLYRLIIDGKTANLNKEEKIAKVLKLPVGMGFATQLGEDAMPDFSTSKDPESDNYAVAIFNRFESDRNKRIEIVVYGSDHTELSRAYFASPKEKYKFLQFISMAVIGSEKVSVLVNGYNNDDENREVILATLKKGASAVSFNELKFPKDGVLHNGIVHYNPYTKKLLVVAKIYEIIQSKEDYLYVAFVDPDKGKTEKLIRTGLNEEVNKLAAKIYWPKNKAWGTPIKLYVNKDGGFSVAYDETAVIFVTYDSLGKTSSSYLVPKSFLLNHPGTLGYAGGFGNQYKTFAYINGTDKSYILVNEIQRNIENLEKYKYQVRITGVGDCDSYYFPLTGNAPIPTRKYLFGESDDKKERNLAAIGVSAYDKENDVFILLRLNKEDKKKSVNLLWLKPQ